MNWIKLAQNRLQYWVIVNTVLFWRRIVFLKTSYKGRNMQHRPVLNGNAILYGRLDSYRNSIIESCF
jgi:hypothetical protein